MPSEFQRLRFPGPTNTWGDQPTKPALTNTLQWTAFLGSPQPWLCLSASSALRRRRDLLHPARWPASRCQACASSPRWPDVADIHAARSAAIASRSRRSPRETQDPHKVPGQAELRDEAQSRRRAGGAGASASSNAFNPGPCWKLARQRTGIMARRRSPTSMPRYTSSPLEVPSSQNRTAGAELQSARANPHFNLDPRAGQS